MKFKMAATAELSLTLDPTGKMFQNASSLKPKSCRSRHFEFHIETKNLKIVEDHPMNIHVQFGFNHICNSKWLPQYHKYSTLFDFKGSFCFIF
jgi:hypothetical protein